MGEGGGIKKLRIGCGIPFSGSRNTPSLVMHAIEIVICLPLIFICLSLRLSVDLTLFVCFSNSYFL